MDLIRLPYVARSCRHRYETESGVDHVHTVDKEKIYYVLPHRHTYEPRFRVKIKNEYN